MQPSVTILELSTEEPVVIEAVYGKVRQKLSIYSSDWPPLVGSECASQGMRQVESNQSVWARHVESRQLGSSE